VKEWHVPTTQWLRLLQEVQTTLKISSSASVLGFHANFVALYGTCHGTAKALSPWLMTHAVTHRNKLPAEDSKNGYSVSVMTASMSSVRLWPKVTLVAGLLLCRKHTCQRLATSPNLHQNLPSSFTDHLPCSAEDDNECTCTWALYVCARTF
jgi:hypothetical protein